MVAYSLIQSLCWALSSTGGGVVLFFKIMQVGLAKFTGLREFICFIFQKTYVTRRPAGPTQERPTQWRGTNYIGKSLFEVGSGVT